MVEHVLTILTVLKVLTAILGFVFLGFALRAYRKHRARPMLILFIAVGLLTAAVLVEGFLRQFIGMGPDEAHVVEASVALVAFAVLVYSLFA